MSAAYLGLGSNEGDRLANLLGAVEQLAATEGIEIVARSSIYQTEPVGDVPDQRDFYNAAVKIETTLAPRELLAACKLIERQLGRVGERARHGPRPIDLDVLLINDLVIEEEDFTVPHPDLTRRRFVLAPLAELDPELTLSDGRTPDQAQAAIGPHQRVEPISGWS